MLNMAQAAIRLMCDRLGIEDEGIHLKIWTALDDVNRGQNVDLDDARIVTKYATKIGDPRTQNIIDLYYDEDGNYFELQVWYKGRNTSFRKVHL